MDVRLRPTFGCPSVLRLLDVYVEPEIPSTSGEGERKVAESSTNLDYFLANCYIKRKKKAVEMYAKIY